MFRVQWEQCQSLAKKTASPTTKKNWEDCYQKSTIHARAKHRKRLKNFPLIWMVKKCHSVKALHIMGNNCSNKSQYKFHSHFCSELWFFFLKNLRHFILYSKLSMKNLSKNNYFVINWVQETYLKNIEKVIKKCG